MNKLIASLIRKFAPDQWETTIGGGLILAGGIISATGNEEYGMLLVGIGGAIVGVTAPSKNTQEPTAKKEQRKSDDRL